MQRKRMRRSASWFKRSNPKLLVNTVYTEFLSPSLPPSSILLNKLYFGTIVDLLIHQSCREFVYLLLRYKYFLNTFDASGTFWACGIQRQNCVSLLLEDHRDCETEWTSNSTHTSDTKRVWVFSSYRLILQLCGDHRPWEERSPVGADQGEWDGSRQQFGRGCRTREAGAEDGH